MSEYLTPERKVKVLQSILDTGACGLNPPTMGWLIVEEIITPTGFDMDKAASELKKLEAKKE